MQKEENFLAWEKAAAFLRDGKTNYTLNQETGEVILPEDNTSPEIKFNISDLSFHNLKLLTQHYIKNNYTEGATQAGEQRKRKNIATSSAINPTMVNYIIEDHSQEQQEVAKHVATFITLAEPDIYNLWRNKNEYSDIRLFATNRGDAKTAISMIIHNANLNLKIDVREDREAITKIINDKNVRYTMALLTAYPDITLSSLDELFAGHNPSLQFIKKVVLHDSKEEQTTFLKAYNGNKVSHTLYKDFITEILTLGSDKDIIALFNVFHFPPSHIESKNAITKILETGNIKNAMSLGKYGIVDQDRLRNKKALLKIMDENPIDKAVQLIKIYHFKLNQQEHSRVIFREASPKDIINKIFREASPKDISSTIVNGKNIELNWSSDWRTIMRVFKTGTSHDISILCSRCTELPILIENYPVAINKILNSPSYEAIKYLIKACPSIKLNEKDHSEFISKIFQKDPNTAAVVIQSNENNHRLLFNEAIKGSKENKLEEWSKLIPRMHVSLGNALLLFIDSVKNESFFTIPTEDIFLPQEGPVNRANLSTDGSPGDKVAPLDGKPCSNAILLSGQSYPSVPASTPMEVDGPSAPASIPMEVAGPSYKKPSSSKKSYQHTPQFNPWEGKSYQYAPQFNPWEDGYTLPYASSSFLENPAENTNTKNSTSTEITSINSTTNNDQAPLSSEADQQNIIDIIYANAEINDHNTLLFSKQPRLTSSKSTLVPQGEYMKMLLKGKERTGRIGQISPYGHTSKKIVHTPLVRVSHTAKPKATKGSKATTAPSSLPQTGL